MLSRARRQAQQRARAYRAAVRRLLVRGGDAARLERLRDAVAIGNAEFAQRVRAWGAEAPLDGVAGKRELYRRIPVAEVRRVVEKVKGELWARFAERYGDWGCALFLWGVRWVCGLTLREAGQAARNSTLQEAQQRILKLSKVDCAGKTCGRKRAEKTSHHDAPGST